MTTEKLGIAGTVIATLYGPDGRVKARCKTHNLITAVGDQFYAGRAALSTGQPAQITGMKLGSGSTATAKTGAGAALATYLADSNKAIDSGFPTAVAGVVTFETTWAEGEATTASPITEAVLVTETITNDDTSTAAETVARALLSGLPSKGADDVLKLIWIHNLVGS